MRMRALVLAAALTVSLLAACHSGRAMAPTPAEPSGPLRILDAEGQLSDDLAWSVGITVDASGLAAVSIGPLHNTGVADIRVTGVTLIDTSGVALAGARIAKITDAGRVDTVGGASFTAFPPDDPELGPPADATGFTMPGTEPPGSLGYGLLIGYSVAGGAATRGHAASADVRYDAGGTSFTLHVPVSVTLCPPGTAAADCSGGGS